MAGVSYSDYSPAGFWCFLLDAYKTEQYGPG